MELAQGNLTFTKLGHGPKPLLAFHGIGQTGRECFQPFASALVKHYTIFAFDLPFHGDSADFPFQPFTKQWLKQILTSFLLAENITHFDVAGFSIGGRFAMAVLEMFPDRIDNAYLMAPDGVTENSLYHFATRYTLARQVFWWTMQHPAPFFFCIKMLQNVGVLNKSLVRFTQQVLNTPEKRHSLYKSWVTFSPLRFDADMLNQLAAESGCHIWLFTGKYDKLLKARAVAPLARILPDNQRIELKCGHTQLVPQAAAWISSYLSKLSDTPS